MIGGRYLAIRAIADTDYFVLGGTGFVPPMSPIIGMSTFIINMRGCWLFGEF